MALLLVSYRKEMICLTIVAAFLFIENVAATSSSPVDIGNKGEEINKTTLSLSTQNQRQPKIVKKVLNANLTELNLEAVTIPPENEDHTEKLVIIDEKSVIETAGKALEQQQPPVAQKGNEKTGLSMAAPTYTLSATETKGHHHEEDEYLIKGDDDISDSLKAGFYFFLILSLGAIIFIMFKIYRLRLSRAERKYGVQGDRTTQELTPLPVSIEDGHSDDEDQTLFEVQRQNIRIL